MSVESEDLCEQLLLLWQRALGGCAAQHPRSASVVQ
jgi:hypothetical protein